MRSLTFFLLLFSASCWGQGIKLAQLKARKEQTDSMVSSNIGALIVFVKITGEDQLKEVSYQDVVPNVDDTYNILKDKSGRVIYVEETSNNNDEEDKGGVKYYFSAKGRLVSLEIKFIYFNEHCKNTNDDIIYDETSFFNSKHKAIKSIVTLTDKGGKELTGDCGPPFDWRLRRPNNVTEFLSTKHIPL